MANFLDIGVLENFSIVFVFILIFAIIYAISEKVNLFGDNKGMYGIISLVVAFLLILSEKAVILINFMTPWFIVLFLFLFLSIFALKMFGFSDSDASALIKNERFFPYIIVIIIIIVIAAFSNMFGQSLLEKGEHDTINVDDNGEEIQEYESSETTSTQTDSFGQNVLNTIIHPKVLGMILVMAIGLFTLIFLTKLA